MKHYIGIYTVYIHILYIFVHLIPFLLCQLYDIQKLIRFPHEHQTLAEGFK